MSTAHQAREERVAESVAGLPIGRWEWALIGTLVMVMLGQMWSSIRQLSVTSDEIDHLHAGYRYLQCNDFGWNPEHPPLVKMVAALPLMFMHVHDPFPNACGMPDNKAVDFHIGHDFVFANPESVLTTARMAASVFTVLLLVVVWLFARALFGPLAAAVAAGLTAFEPNILAHGSLVTTDVAAAAGILLAVYACYLYASRPTPGRLLGLGIATGFALCIKHSTVLLALVLPALMLIQTVWVTRPQWLRYAGRRLLALCVVAGIAVIMLWGAYGFRYAARPSQALTWAPFRLREAHGFFATQVVPTLEHWRVLPESYLAGLQDVAVESNMGRPSFLFGRTYWGGRWYYFPGAAVIKLTGAMLVLLALALFAGKFWKKHLPQLAFLGVPGTLLLLPAMGSNLNVGFRHVLPIVPLAAIFASAGALTMLRRGRTHAVALGVILAYHAVSSLHAFPNYLSYSNEIWGGPENTYKVLSDSNVDWGQAQKIARDYVEANRPAACFFVRTYNQRNADYGIPCGEVSEMFAELPPEEFTGTLIVSSSLVDGIVTYEGGTRAAQIFRQLHPVAKLGGSALLVYRGTFQMGPIISAILLRQASPEPQAIIRQAQLAAMADPGNSDAHMTMCGRYAELSDMGDAQRECNLGLHLILTGGDNSLQQKERAARFIANLRIKIDASNQALLQSQPAK